MISLNGVKIVPTMFPDGTSQVWKLPADLLETLYKGYLIEVLWEFESEAELVHLAQLKTLLDTYSPVVHLDMPYLPYARQDKRVDNASTFALTAFARILNALKFTQVTVLDAHNDPRAHAIFDLVNKSPREFISEAIDISGADTILFPDEGASARYAAYELANSVTAKKTRDQSTGEILRTSINGSVKGCKLLIVDDICDGGATFKGVAEAALTKKAGALEVHLYVTHGIFSKGLKTLRDSGIKRIFTRKGEVK